MVTGEERSIDFDAVQWMKWRVKYWRWINEYAGEWYRTGLMTKESAEKVAESFRQYYEQVDVYYDDDGK